MLKPTIISISMATVMAGAAISPALGLIAEAFPDASETMIKLILTAPSIMIIPFSFLSSYLTSKITKRTIIMIGLVIYLIGGVGAQLMSTIELLLAFRLFLGAGVGLVMPLSMSLINDYFKGSERTKMMGYNSAFSNVGVLLLCY
ncbi:MFS transporter [Virgibacillus halodenitrificans]|nr:MFS transporter [Virgibacillus halodenitrificans]MCJ0930653.1 MFS transporter [Virgibacillus halodenitrificans]